MLVVAVALMRGDGLVLMQRRRAGRQHGGLWEFPGGKVEAGESLTQAAAREIAEELGVAVLPEALAPVGFATNGTGDSSGPVILLFACDEWTGDPACLDAEEIGWFAPDALANLPMPPLDYPLAQALRRVVSHG